MKISWFCCSSGIFWGLVLSTVYGILFSLPRRRSFAGCGGHLNLDICCVGRRKLPQTRLAPRQLPRGGSQPSQSKPDGFDSSPEGGASGAPGKFLIASKTLAIGLTACALSVTFGDSSPKGRAKSTAGNFLIIPNTLVLNFTAWLPPWGSWRGSA